jgi:hypothetical protein
MSLNFFSLPSEVRNTIYEMLLLNEEPIDPCAHYHRPRVFAIRLFRANKAVHREASSLFYAQNCFDFTDHTSHDIVTFLDQVGPHNASYIRHIYIDFPRLPYLRAGNITLEDESDRILAKIQRSCPKLRTLKTSLFSTNAMELRLDAQDTNKIFSEALRLVDTRFRACSSLQEIIVEAYEDDLCDYLRTEMKNCGWTVSLTEYVEEIGYDWFDEDEDYGGFLYDSDVVDEDYWIRNCH